MLTSQNMSLCGPALVAIWHNVIPEERQAFFAWHTREHMPERLSLRGFLRGRRYHAIAGEPEFFNFYEAESVAVLSGPEYIARLNNPTPWTRQIVPHFRDVARSIFRVVHTSGVGQGGVMLTVRVDFPETSQAAIIDPLRTTLLPSLAEAAGITGVHLCYGEGAASRIETAESLARSVPTQLPSCLVMLEGLTASAVKDASSTLSATLSTHPDKPTIRSGIYQLNYSRGRTPAG